MSFPTQGRHPDSVASRHASSSVELFVAIFFAILFSFFFLPVSFPFLLALCTLERFFVTAVCHVHFRRPCEEESTILLWRR
jgi:hypothetical protein